MKVVTGEQMGEIDRLAREMGVPTIELMENAGRVIYEAAHDILGEGIGWSIVIVCGKGNNGGDGLVAARLLHEEGAAISVLLIPAAADLQGEPKTNLERAQEAGVPIEEQASGERITAVCQSADLVIDALLGTGVSGPVKGEMAEAIAAINKAGRHTLAVDIPSGVNADTGEVASVAVVAHHTVTMGLPKWGMLNYPGADYVGHLIVADIGLPAEAVNAVSSHVECFQPQEVAALLPHRRTDVHKGDFAYQFPH